MIEVNNLVKTFDGFRALDGVTLKVETGSIYGLMGPNGAGKSTLIRHLLGVYRQDEGEVKYDGEKVWDNVPVKARIASIPDDWFYYGQATVKDMCDIYKGMYESFSMERFNALKEAFNIDEKKTIKYLSKGMQKQVAFWLALSTMSDYIILDEPVDGLDPVMRRRVWSLIMDDVSSRGTTVLVSSHNLRELEDVCDHVGIMNHGKVVLERSLSELQDNMVKLQVVFKEGEEEPAMDGIEVLHDSLTGRVHTMIVRMCPESAVKAVKKYDPVLVEAIPLTLEEIFVYEMGGLENEIKNILV
ncbi:MAG: ABC transporter ATP-binding protein [Lachnospiraceae bacterium]|nr:ABC transporter ATP-binding protein [Lachnospiraceae bacterium]